jgi:hypothetical protein
MGEVAEGRWPPPCSRDRGPRPQAVRPALADSAGLGQRAARAGVHASGWAASERLWRYAVVGEGHGAAEPAGGSSALRRRRLRQRLGAVGRGVAGRPRARAVPRPPRPDQGRLPVRSRICGRCRTSRATAREIDQMPRAVTSGRGRRRGHLGTGAGERGDDGRGGGAVAGVLSGPPGTSLSTSPLTLAPARSRRWTPGRHRAPRPAAAAHDQQVDVRHARHRERIGHREDGAVSTSTIS